MKYTVSMKALVSLFFCTAIVMGTKLFAQDTFSIVAADSTTREVGSAGASCVDLFAAGFADPSFLGQLLPDTGAINTQADYTPANQNNARIRMRAGDTPIQIINWLAKHDAGGNSSIRQYGIVGFKGDVVSAAGYTGTNCINYKNHVTGNIDGIYYSIQGNILLGQQILDSMEYKFRNATGDIACRLMAALQGANVVGADTRCAPDGTSSLFAFLKVAQPSDTYGNPSFSISLRTHDNTQIEPIDSLQTIFDAQHSCEVTGIKEVAIPELLKVYPNPADNEITIKADPSLIGSQYIISDSSGRHVAIGTISGEIKRLDIQRFAPGLYVLAVGQRHKASFMKN
jgi:uncharacterized Ntn-hydrolase superfamily protein